MKTQIRKREWTPAKEFLPIILGKEIEGDLGEKDLEKLDLFEKGLANELKKDDTIDQAITKIVKMAVAAEFGPSLVAAKGAKAMIETISRAITSDSELRKQALVIIDRFATNQNK
ncbi:MAG: hypothetical protein HQ596_08620 [Candidatus Saganbacteria bacterium]|nr:hypothetical protein [Candidatus Saganbacteria bacterium]